MSQKLQAILFAVLIATSIAFLPADARAQGQPKPSAGRPAVKKKWRLRITEGDILGVSLEADKARMIDIAADLSKRLRAPVSLGPSLRKEALTVEFADLTFEPAMGLIAPRVLIDYEIRASAQPKILAIYLLGLDDPEPAKNETVKGSSEAMMIEGNTEDEAASAADYEDDPLQVDLNDNLLTIKSKKQPLIAVILTIAEVLEVPAEIKYETSEIVDTVIRDVPFEDAIARLSPNARIYVRADLTRSQRTPLRLALLPPPVPKAPDSAMSQ
jgi:hypothetical protein